MWLFHQSLIGPEGPSFGLLDNCAFLYKCCIRFSVNISIISPIKRKKKERLWIQIEGLKSQNSSIFFWSSLWLKDEMYFSPCSIYQIDIFINVNKQQHVIKTGKMHLVSMSWNHFFASNFEGIASSLLSFIPHLQKYMPYCQLICKLGLAHASSLFFVSSRTM